MVTTTRDSLVADYLRELERAARALPRSQRDELVAEIREHLDSGLGPDATEAAVRNLLDDLGTPAAIVAATQPERAPMRRGAREMFGLILLATGFPPILGWLAGVGLVLWSPLWTGRQKLLGILVWPGGLVAAIGVSLALAPTSNQISCDLTAGGQVIAGSCVNTDTGVHPAMAAILIIAMLIPPIIVAAYLYWAAGRQADGT
jgi:HAAS